MCMKGLDLYKGDFLPKSEYESWVIPISTYYHSLYQKLVYKTIELLMEREDYGAITSVCQTAIGIEPFDEQFHYYLVYSLYKDNHISQAVDHYNHTLDLFYNEFSISPSEHFKELYKTIRNKEQGINTNLDSIQEACGRKPAAVRSTANTRYSGICTSWSAGPSSEPAIPSTCAC